MSENSETKWTAGPWDYENILKILTEGPDRWADRRNDEANARLIAATPDLYKGCEMALNAFENNWAINWDDLRRALDKARGTR